MKKNKRKREKKKKNRKSRTTRFAANQNEKEGKKHVVVFVEGFL